LNKPIVVRADTQIDAASENTVYYVELERPGFVCLPKATGSGVGYTFHFALNGNAVSFWSHVGDEWTQGRAPHIESGTTFTVRDLAKGVWGIE
jgi:hypothetical protein